jgi:ParB-like chromosome segregation protein Spo0J
VLVSGDGKVIAEHGRLLAATQLGLTEAPVIVLDHLTEEQRRAYRIADNKLTELGAWDEALLSGELQELAAVDVNLGLLGFSDAELDQLLAFDADGDGDTECGEEDIPEDPEDPVSRAGDLWLLSRHRLLCGDATVITDLDRLMAGLKTDLCFTDSPCNVDYAGGVGAEKAGKGSRILNDALGDGFVLSL